MNEQITINQAYGKVNRAANYLEDEYSYMPDWSGKLPVYVQDAIVLLDAIAENLYDEMTEQR